MNRLSTAERARIVACLVEGNNLRATQRMVGCSINTIQKLLLDLGEACSVYMDAVFRDLPCKRVQADEIWSFCGMKEKNVPAEHKGKLGYGDVWTWVALDAETKLVPTYVIGKRDPESARAFVDDLASRLASRIQLSTDGLKIYIQAVDSAFGDAIDYGMLVKHYTNPPQAGRETRYSPAECCGVTKTVMTGTPDKKHISTSFIERQNLTMRMGMRRFTRLTNGHSRKIENLMAAVSLHFMHYNFARPHASLPKGVTPAMAAGVAKAPWDLEMIAALLD